MNGKIKIGKRLYEGDSIVDVITNTKGFVEIHEFFKKKDKNNNSYVDVASVFANRCFNYRVLIIEKIKSGV